MIRLQIPATLLSIALVGGCASDDRKNLDPILEDTAISLAGTYVGGLVPVEDGCGLGIELAEFNTFDVTVSDNGKVFSFFSDGTDFDCALAADSTFECDVDSPAGGILPVTTTMKGTWTSADRFEAEFAMSLICEGEQCDFFAEAFEEAKELPCSTVGNITATRAMNDDFVIDEGEFFIESELIEGVTTCKNAAPSPLGIAVDIVDAADGTFELAKIPCEMGEGGSFFCHLEEEEGRELVYEYTIAAAWTAGTVAEGFVEVRVTCGGDDCSEPEGEHGELPCVAYTTLDLQ